MKIKQIVSEGIFDRFKKKQPAKPQRMPITDEQRAAIIQHFPTNHNANLKWGRKENDDYVLPDNVTVQFGKGIINFINYDGNLIASVAYHRSKEDRMNPKAIPLTHFDEPINSDQDLEQLKSNLVEGSLNEFALDGFNGGDDGEEFNPKLAKMAYDEGVVKGVSLADGATLERAMAINDWDKHDGGIYKQHFAKGFKAGRMNKIRHGNEQYNLNLKLMKDGSIRHSEQGVAEGQLDELSKDTLKSYFPKRHAAAKAMARTDYDKANRIAKSDMPRAMRKLKDPGYGQQGVAEGMFGLSDKIKGKIQNITSELSDIPGYWDHEAQTFTEKGLESLERNLKRPEFIKYALSLTADDYDADLEEGETWSKHNNPRAGGMSKKSVSSYRRSHPGSKIQTAVTTKPSKLKKGSKAAARRKSFCARMKGMKKHRTGAKTARDPNSNINKSLRRWNCESVEQMQELVMLAEQLLAKHKK